MYNIIKNLEDEHIRILAFIDNFEEILISLMEKDEFYLELYNTAITFVREFADKRHHQGEEQILFRYMIDHAGSAAEKLVRQGMLVEHDQARFYIKELESAVHRYHENPQLIDKLAILSYAKSYCDLLRRHIEKENEVVYPFAERTLSKELFEEIEKEDKAYQILLDSQNNE